ncbi:hypothetical protein ACHAWO_012317 [Cyclotella atomus]|uniref:Signal peptide peptidase n=1 Tax=Cyclotella atomus TaxID=382360 RepID=A0ABD3QJQ1_9STRA
MAKNPILLLSYTTIIGLWIASQKISIPYVAHLLLLVTAILYAACHNSLALREEQAYARGEKPDDYEPPQDGEADSSEVAYETLKASDAAQFPILGSASLFGLYCAFKYFDKDTVNLIISVYFCFVGCAALTASFSPLIESLGSKKSFLSNKFSLKKKVNHPLPEAIGGKSPWDVGVDGNVADVIAFVASVAFCVAYFRSKHWTMNNVLGICFCLQGIERFSLGTYKIGAILLVGLFFYDIFWVFGTDVMVTVAKSLDGPIKILFPRSIIPDPTTGKLEMSLLGLGDIVIPGFFLALLLRFDAHNANVPCFPTDVHVSFPKPYFHSALVGYVIGLGVTLYVMIVFEAAQPALLYLVPACLGSSLACAFVRGQMKELFDYSEEEEENKEDDLKDDKAKKNE